MIVLSSMMPGNLIFIAGHFHEDSTAQVWNQCLVVGEPGNCANGLWSEPKADAHRSRRKRIPGKPPRQLDCADHTCAIVVRLHRMTGVRLHEELPCFGV